MRTITKRAKMNRGIELVYMYTQGWVMEQVDARDTRILDSSRT